MDLCNNFYSLIFQNYRRYSFILEKMLCIKKVFLEMFQTTNESGYIAPNQLFVKGQSKFLFLFFKKIISACKMHIYN